MALTWPCRARWAARPGPHEGQGQVGEPVFSVAGAQTCAVPVLMFACQNGHEACARALHAQMSRSEAGGGDWFKSTQAVSVCACGRLGQFNRVSDWRFLAGLVVLGGAVTIQSRELDILIYR